LKIPRVRAGCGGAGGCGGGRSPEPHAPAWSRFGLGSVLSGEFCGDDSGLLLVFEPVAIALDVDGG
jgi:hypothetical protein